MNIATDQRKQLGFSSLTPWKKSFRSLFCPVSILGQFGVEKGVVQVLKHR